ncbi:hypothetical protein PUN28_012101 [Cardiocondyla obscurior]|uniref:Uncharacterized protein n=1 Tax=Cardiocondyla obscurior TaxID=286306 RepID=A0AAW2FBE3_9HYME
MYNGLRKMKIDSETLDKCNNNCYSELGFNNTDIIIQLWRKITTKPVRRRKNARKCM